MEQSKKLRVLNYSTHDEDCGIGKYQEDFVRLLAGRSDIQSDFYETSPNVVRRLKGPALSAELERLKKALKDYDILHIQHEFGFYHGDGEGLKYITDIAEYLGKKIVITIHTAPSLVYQPVVRSGNSIRARLGHRKRLAASKEILQKRLFPFRTADLIITLNPHTTDELVNIVGIDREKIYQTVIPTEPTHISDADKKRLRKDMEAKDNEVILGTIGFLSDKKGVDQAVKSLKFLPEDYKLAILGGVNPASGNPEIYDRICDLIVSLELQDRVFISGYIQDDAELDKLVSGVDIALYPYNPEYYRLASSAAVNTAINNRVPVIAYPAESFKEINRRVEGTITVTQSPNYYELVKAVKTIDVKQQDKRVDEYIKSTNIDQASDKLVDLYRSLY